MKTIPLPYDMGDNETAIALAFLYSLILDEAAPCMTVQCNPARAMVTVFDPHRHLTRQDHNSRIIRKEIEEAIERTSDPGLRDVVFEALLGDGV